MTEDQLEQECLGWLADVGWQHRYGPDIAPDGKAPERDNYRQVLLLGQLRSAVASLNPGVPAAEREDAVRQVLDLGTPLAAGRQPPVPPPAGERRAGAVVSHAKPPEPA